jgi:hypothetical protein
MDPLDEDHLYAVITASDEAEFVKCLKSVNVDHVFSSTSVAKIRGMTLLRVAAVERSLPIARLLIQRKCDVDKAGHKVNSSACFLNDTAL